MSSTVVLGVPVPKMLPVTGTWTLPFAAYLLVLSNRVVMNRINNKKYLGDSLDSSSDPSSGADPLLLTTRAHANFLENVPLAFIMVAVAELNGGNRKALNIAMGVLLAMRIAHVEVGLKGKDTVGPGRPFAYFGSQAFLGGLAAYGAYLVKGYWGF
ncbi:MAG: hypothetical protein M1830_008259 [Pleopsidium flavum]|nr:MAG: hypothetical protein M1830_008259 [Pleopsidium flavum]